MSDANYRPNGELQGDTKPMPDRGVNTGVTDTYGGNLKTGLKGGKSSITGATGSDGFVECGLSKNKRGG